MSALTVEDQVISQIVVERVGSLLVVAEIFIHGRLDCYCSFAKIQDKK